MVAGIPLLLILFLAGVGMAVAATAGGLISGTISASAIATSREWLTIIKIVAILVMIVLVIYMSNAERYTGVDFIYGRF